MCSAVIVQLSVHSVVEWSAVECSLCSVCVMECSVVVVDVVVVVVVKCSEV